MKTTQLDHIAVAVEDLDRAAALYEKVWGARIVKTEKLDSWGVEVAHLEVGGTAIELICPLTKESGIAKFLDNRGPSLHHLAFRVDDIQSALEELGAEGIRSLDKEPRRGAHETVVAFLHPKDTGGVLTELVQLD